MRNDSWYNMLKEAFAETGDDFGTNSYNPYSRRAACYI